MNSNVVPTFTIDYNGAGLGDLINQVTFSHSFCFANGFDFFIPKIWSSHHGVDYAAELGLLKSDAYRPDCDLSSAKILKSSALVKENFGSSLISVKWDYRCSNHYKLYGIKRVAFPFLQYYPLPLDGFDKKTAVLHLRMGDARSYITRGGSLMLN